jgi:hypothetical protein
MKQRRFQLIASSIVLFAVVAACSLSPAASATAGSATGQPAGASGSGACTNAYFPDTSGTTWAYSSTGGSLGAYTYTRTITDAIATGFSTSEQYSTGTNATIKWNCQDGNLAALDDGSSSLSLSSSKFKFTSTSVTADGYDIPNNFETGTSWSEKVTASGVVQYGTKSLDAQIVSDVACSAAGTDSITVTAGKFDTVKATCTDSITVSEITLGTPVPATAPITVNITNWYAKGVGLVQSVRVNSLGGGQTIVLTQYKVQ